MTSKKWAIASIAVLIVFALILIPQMGFYTVQPIGALPQGVTLLVWREEGEPFFNSPDAVCLQRLSSVSLLCRAMAIGEAPKENRIILRLPYWEFAYLRSTGGEEFEK